MVLAIWVCLVVLAAAGAASAQRPVDDEAYDVLDRRGPDPINEIRDALRRWSRVILVIGAALLALVALKIIRPLERYRGAHERLLRRAVRDVDDLLKRIQQEAEETTSDPKTAPTTDGGILAGMAELAELEQTEQVPAYVLTVNDLMLDKVRTTLHRLRRFREPNAQRYRAYMVSVLDGIKTLTEQSAQNHVPSSLAVDVRDYFRDEQRYRAWSRLLAHLARQGEHADLAQSFAVFMRNVREGEPLTPAEESVVTQKTAIITGPPAPKVPDALDEQTLPILQKAAAREAANLVSLVLTGQPSDRRHAWQFELVARQAQLRNRDEAQKMLGVFLSTERRALPQITRTRMLPCRTWPHVLYLLGVKSGATLAARIEGCLLTIQEIVILQKMFLQTFAKKASLAHVYGAGDEADLMLNLHVPQVRRETLTVLRRCHETEPTLFARATQELDEEETRQHHEVGRLIRHYIEDRHNPPAPHR